MKHVGPADIIWDVCGLHGASPRASQPSIKGLGYTDCTEVSVTLHL